MSETAGLSRLRLRGQVLRRTRLDNREPVTGERTAHQKVALITGADKGTGRGVAEQLAALGRAVLIGARDLRRGGESAAAVRAAGRDAHAVVPDVTDQGPQQGGPSAVPHRRPLPLRVRSRPDLCLRHGHGLVPVCVCRPVPVCVCRPVPVCVCRPVPVCVCRPVCGGVVGWVSGRA
ncbi:SDR family NAD(P)-dependent oxidoreductase [Streptomyces sp. NBC_00637]|uniref:SDR family NAD(P)-dependent oxidoreductase n=1 Tax=Streptomyces sp. NBC_00637 TaxID=2903667 RepID=UPI00324E4573